uniref:Uncharacterized protein n=1 Tax=Anguilla anguilla TaxID=7936 RepID=A0A0E9QQB4_ANGAN
MMILGLFAVATAMETHFMELPINNSCADIASGGSVEVGSECCNRGQTLLASAPFCELVWLSWLSCSYS